MTAYETYQKLKLGAALGLEPRGEESVYFCTPKGARIFGWAGVDGIHYCFVQGFGDRVFAVSPMNAPDDCVQPLAESFRDFLRLLLACGGPDALEQAHGWTAEQFDAFVRTNPPDQKRRAALAVLAERLALTPMENPYAYITALQAGFDRSRLRYPPEYAEHTPSAAPPLAWRVYFNGSFGGCAERTRPGKEIAVGKSFLWGGESWLIPALYLCGKGLVIDFCARVEPKCIQSFMERWNLTSGSEETAYTDEEQMQMEGENPLGFDVRPRVKLGKNTLEAVHSCGISWNPCLPQELRQEEEAQHILRHYGLDPAFGWRIWRASFPWATRTKPKVRALRITLAQEPVDIPGRRFSAAAPGDSVPFTHPVSGARHVLTVQSCEEEEIAQQEDGWEIPTHFTVMQYTLSPDLPPAAFRVQDCMPGDRPRQRTEHGQARTAGSAAIGIIGGADGPVAVIFGGRGAGKLHSACSALRFEAVKNVEWRMIFREKQREDISVDIVL